MKYERNSCINHWGKVIKEGKKRKMTYTGWKRGKEKARKSGERGEGRKEENIYCSVTL
jgi:hypothetical protein